MPLCLVHVVLIKVETTRLVGVTTDGENANTGKVNGLWKLHVKRTYCKRYPGYMVCLSSLRSSFRVRASPGSGAFNLDVGGARG